MTDNKKEAPRKGGFRDATPKEFREELLQIDRVTRVTAGGRQLRFRASVVIGDNKGRVGLGMGKAGEVVVAIEKAVRDAKKNIVKIQIIDGTIAHNITAKYKAASIMLHPASQGTGIIAGGSVRKLISVSGIKDILAKRYGSTNAITNARVALKALSLIKNVPSPAKKIVEEVKTEVVAEEVEKVAEVEIKEDIKLKTIVPEVKKEAVKKPKSDVVVKEIKKATEVKAKKEVKKSTPKKAPAKKTVEKKPVAIKATIKKPAIKK